MPDFPQLRTGAVIQYPARRHFSFATRVLRFIDGTEQRFRLWPSVLHQWVIRLDLLTEEELGNLSPNRLGMRHRNGASLISQLSRVVP